MMNRRFLLPLGLIVLSCTALAACLGGGSETADRDGSNDSDAEYLAFESDDEGNDKGDATGGDNERAHFVWFGTGSEFTVAVDSAQRVWGWGLAGNGQLCREPDDFDPRLVEGLEGAVMAVSAGSHSIIAMEDGTLLACGSNGDGRLGIGTTGKDEGTPQKVVLKSVRSLAAAGNHNLALMEDGTVMSWGNNELGELGDGTHNDRAVPSAVLDAGGQPLADVIAIDAAASYSLALLNTGRVLAWGGNHDGTLGNPQVATAQHRAQGSQSVAATAMQWDSTVPVEVTGLNEIVAIAAGEHHGLAVNRQGEVFGWGFNDEAAIRSGAAEVVRTAVKIQGAEDVIAVGASDDYSLALKRDGTLLHWGSQRFGTKLTGKSDRPAPIPGLRNIERLFAGPYHVFVLDGSGRAWGWGMNNMNQLGSSQGEDTQLKPAPIDFL